MGRNWWTLGLSPSLLDALADWQEEFEVGFDTDDGWHRTTTADAWTVEGRALAVHLRDALPLEVDLWPTDRTTLTERLLRRLRR